VVEGAFIENLDARDVPIKSGENGLDIGGLGAAC
jgi:hypothetical protein